MRTVYGIQFDVKPKSGQSPSECLAEMKELAASWISEKYGQVWDCNFTPKFDGERREPASGHWINANQELHGEYELVTVEWGHPDDRDQSIVWVTSCTFARNGESVYAAITIRISSIQFVLRPTSFVLGRPQLLWNIFARFDCFVGEDRITTRHTSLKAMEMASFVHEVLLSKGRSLPVVMISPDIWTEQPVLGPSVAQNRLIGFARVVALADKWAAFQLTDAVGKPLSCFNGAVRIYWPGFSLDDIPHKHPLYLADSIRFHSDQGRGLESHLFKVLSGMSAFRVSELGPILKVRQQIERLTKSDIGSLRQQAEAGTAENELLLDEMEKQLQQAEKLGRERDDLALKVEELTEELLQQKANWAACQEYFTSQPNKDEISPETEIKTDTIVSSVSDAASKAEHEFKETMLFLESAKHSAKESPYQKADMIYHLFETLNELCATWKKDGKLGVTWKAALTDRGFEYKPDISDTTKGKFKNNYMFNYGGKKLLFGEHVTFGIGQDPQKCLSVHWYRDESNRLLVVGHCGRHLANTKA